MSNSFDMTTDILIERLPHDLVFRLNLDLIFSYNIHFSGDGFEIVDPTGRAIRSSQISKAYLRKIVWPNDINQTDDEKYAYIELSYLFKEILSWLRRNEKLVLVEPYAEHRVGKLAQLEVAKDFLNVPSWEVTFNVKPRRVSKDSVTKSLSGALLGDKVLYATLVDTSVIDSSELWFLQNTIRGPYEVTVVVIREKLFAYKLIRNHPNFALDWREFISNDQKWELYALKDSEKSGIRNVMETLKLHYARFDFVLDFDNNLQFCELNPNGQFAWLDLDEEDGLLETVINEISPLTPVNPLPRLFS